jgi:hypothetical protein
MSWLWVVGAVWLMLAVLVGVLIGRGIRLADHKKSESAPAPNFVVQPGPDPAGAQSDPRQASQPVVDQSAPRPQGEG